MLSKQKMANTIFCVTSKYGLDYNRRHERFWFFRALGCPARHRILSHQTLKWVREQTLSSWRNVTRSSVRLLQKLRTVKFQDSVYREWSRIWGGTHMSCEKHVNWVFGLWRWKLSKLGSHFRLTVWLPRFGTGRKGSSLCCEIFQGVSLALRLCSWSAALVLPGEWAILSGKESNSQKLHSLPAVWPSASHFRKIPLPHFKMGKLTAPAMHHFHQH